MSTPYEIRRDLVQTATNTCIQNNQNKINMQEKLLEAYRHEFAGDLTGYRKKVENSRVLEVNSDMVIAEATKLNDFVSNAKWRMEPALSGFYFGSNPK
jgi:hypothetical protein